MSTYRSARESFMCEDFWSERVDDEKKIHYLSQLGISSHKSHQIVDNTVRITNNIVDFKKYQKNV